MGGAVIACGSKATQLGSGEDNLGKWKGGINFEVKGLIDTALAEKLKFTQKFWIKF